MPSSHPVVCFGEVLWDLLPSGAVPGGAPMNVAYHLHKLGKEPALITRTGRDREGEELRAIFSGEGIRTDYFQLDDAHQTGKVYARPVSPSEMAYEIVQPVAWDFIALEKGLEELVAGAQYFVFGSLAARSEVSRTTLMQLLKSARKTVFDINLRAPHYNKNTVEELLPHASLLKLNDSELALLSDWYGWTGTPEDQVRRLARHFGLPSVVLTLGGEGALLWQDGQWYRHGGFRVAIVDTVGSGDAFLAALLSKLMDGTAPAEALRFANGLGAFVASRRGACPAYRLEEPQILMAEDSSRNKDNK